MIREYKTKGLFEEEQSVIQYFGEDIENIEIREEIKERIKKYMYKECSVKLEADCTEQGIIIGFEDNLAFNDYYYIVYVPAKEMTYYMLANDSEFVRGIKA